MRSFRTTVALVLLSFVFSSALLAQGNSAEAQLRALNAETLRLRGLLQGTGNLAQVGTQGSPVIEQRRALLESLMASDPKAALQLAFPADVLADLANAFPASAGSLETRGAWQGTLYYHVEDGVGFTWHHEVRKLKIGNDMVDLYSPSAEVAGSKCNEVVAATGIRSGNKIVAESSNVIAAALNPACSTTGAQKIAVILVSFPGSALPATIDQNLLNGIFLGNAASSNTSNPDWSISDMWTQNSDGKTWVNASGSGALTVVGPYTLSQNYSYCSVDANGNYSDNSSAVRQAAYAAANTDLDYTQFSRIVLILPHNGSCNPIAGVGTIGCWGSECPGDGVCNISWTWWRHDQMSSRSTGVRLGTHEMGHNLGMGHSGSRDHGTIPVGPIGVAGTRVEYGDLFSTMGSWNFGFYNAQHALNQLGWLSTANVRTVNSTGTYTIQNYDGRPAGVKALKIQRGTGTTNAWLYLAYYPNDAIYLNQLGSQIHSGAIIHYQDSATPGGKTDLLDFTATDSFSDPALAVGQTWVDPYTDLSVTIDSITNGNLNVVVNYNSPPCTAANPTVTISPLSASVVAGSPYGFQVSVKNNDSVACTSRAFTLSSALPSDAGWGSSFSPGTLTIAPGATSTATLTKTPPVSAVGSYAVDATATSGSNADTTDVNASLTVTVPPPAPPAAPSNLTGTAQYTGNGRNKVVQSVQLNWQDNSANETLFRIERCQVSGKGKNTTCTYGPLTTVGANVTSYSDPAASLNGSGTYKYHVRAENGNGYSAWVEIQVQVQ